ncbi:rop guanine nucleotide exchange factor-like protein [Rhynchospora pubera]|uniref:Rop guanine nucleotide exchange factor-like protein n=1 Tax=Rhynchospora pubera TaxID=906938 RepID=A0AAV8BU29_9POAL|nr:rop guanine nucleotide exchange factor-like protein [Rhynchospora pubera]
MSSMDSTSNCDESSESDLNPSQEDLAFPLSEANSLFSLSKRLDELLISYESLHKAWPLQEPVRLPAPVENKLSVKDRAEVLDQRAADNEVQVVRERFSKLLLGEDMSGSGKGVSSAVAISNAITNLYATVFGNCHKLEPLPAEKKILWQREMDCLLSVCDYIVELFPSSQSLPDGTKLEVMATRPRSDISINLPALEKLDAMLLDMLDDFEKTEFWYIDENKSLLQDNAVTPLVTTPHRSVDKWWLPVPSLPNAGISEKAIKDLRQKRDCAYQIHKAALAINCAILAEMEIPESYIQALPKSGRACVGDSIYRYMSTLDRFSPEHLIDCLKISSEHEALALANCVEAAMYVWQRKARPARSKPSWSIVKELMDASDKNFVLATRAESVLLSLRNQFPSLPQSRVDTSKIQHNKDVGQAILESYSRVLESLAHNIVSLIDDVLFTDASVKQK